MTTVSMIAPSGVSGQVQAGGLNYVMDANGVVSVPSLVVAGLLAAGFRFYRTALLQATFIAPFIADLVSIKAAATPANGAITIVKQPDYPRKLQIRVVIGTPTTTQITAGTLTLVGVDQDGNAITEVISLVMASSATLKSTYAYAKLTSGTVAAYTADGSGTGNTLGLGVANDLGICGGGVALTCAKATKIIHTYTGSGSTVTTVAVIASDDVAATVTIDTVARTIAPTTAPGAAATTSTDFIFNCTAGIAD